MIHELHLKEEPYKAIENGTKTIEMRLYDEKRQKIHKGDILEFENNKNHEKLKAVVLHMHIFRSFDEIYSKFNQVNLGYAENEMAKPEDMEKYYSQEEIRKYGVVGIEIKLLKELKAKDLIDFGICPTCFDQENNNCIYGDSSDKIIYENDDFKCFFVGNPRAEGHVAISSKIHYKDMMEIPDDLCREIFLFAKEAMIAIKRGYRSESVYLCTMCDGPMNHFHLQLIPRYAFEQRGSKNFVKERKTYVEDKEKLEELRKRLKDS